MATGRKPNTAGFGFEDAGIQVDEHLQTQNLDVYAAGDCIGNPMYVYVAAYGGSLAAEAGEIIREATIAIRFGLRVQDLVETFHPCLTKAEGLKLAAITFDKNVKQLSCCAA